MTLNQRWAATIIGALVKAGVRHVVVAPGSRSTPLALAAADRDLKTWPVMDERVAAFFALGLAKGSQAPVAIVCTSGTAGAHLLPAIIEARESGVCLVAVTADRPWELHGAGAAQTIDQHGLFGQWVRESVSLGVPEDDEAIFRHLASSIVAALGRASRAPVHLNVPFREPLAPESAAPGPVIDPHVSW
jgi:2-succinyl-5-enolpyruvyl-6-hydroxy-3-cyclohexene-1-carboxylate synthase